MTDPQIPCRDCKRPTQHATEICDDCRTPAGRLLTELRALLIKGKAIDGFEVKVGDLLVSADPASWAICHESEGEDHDGNITGAANAIAAIVQAPGLRAENATLAAEVKRLREEMEKPAIGPWCLDNIGRWGCGALDATGWASVAMVGRNLGGVEGVSAYVLGVKVGVFDDVEEARQVSVTALVNAGYRRLAAGEVDDG